MTTEEKRIKIAEACGLKTIRRDYHWRIGDHLVHGNGTIVPAYFNDLNAMHEAEKKIVDWVFWRIQLSHVVGIGYAPDLDICEDIKSFASATAAQRAEAFGLTLNLWNPGE